MTRDRHVGQAVPPAESFVPVVRGASRKGARIVIFKRSNQMSIATKRGDTGQTGLSGGIRVSKTDNPRVECYGTIDESHSRKNGFARSIRAKTPKSPKKSKPSSASLYKVGSAIATLPEIEKDAARHHTCHGRCPRSRSTSHRSGTGRARRLVVTGRFARFGGADVARTVGARADRL